MKLELIKREHIIKAGQLVEDNGIEQNQLTNNNYWVEFPNGKEYPFKYLTRIAYQLAEGQNAPKLDFNSNDTYRNYIQSLGFKINFYRLKFNFITKNEVSFYATIAGKSYRKENKEDIRKGNLLRPLVYKINLWGKESLIEDFTIKKDYHWQWSGTFKSYLWLRIARESGSKKVFFVIGCNKEGILYISLSCQRSNHTSGTTKPLPTNKIQKFDEYLRSSNYSDKNITTNQLKSYNWDKLITETQAFILEHASLYDELEAMITTNTSLPELEKSDELKEEEPPEKTKSFTNITRAYNGKDINWKRKHDESTSLGLAGEELVIKYEKQKLESINRKDLADQVCKMKDGAGYDILSFDKEGKEIHIEVKTTVRDKDEPFYISLNEVSFFKENPEGYWLFRVFAYDLLNNTARFYKMNIQELKSMTFKPINFEVSKD